MIDRLARVLAAAFPDRDAEQLAEAVLLAARWAEPGRDPADLLAPRNGDRASPNDAGAKQTAESSDTVPTAADLTLPAGETDSLGGLEVRVTEVGFRLPATVSSTPATATALSLFRRIHQPGPPAIDVDATVEATADARQLVVVTRPGHERGLDAAIVVDPTPVALAWAQVIDELEGTLRRTGAFRSVIRWTLDHTVQSASGEPLLRDSAGVLHHADQLVDPAGRRLVLVLSDGTSHEWRRSGTWQVLRRWAWAMPTTLVHLLPPSYWGWTAIGQPSGAVRSLRPAEPNATLEFRSAWWSDEDAPSGDVPIPVIDLDPDAIVQWARAIVSGSAWTEAVRARLPGPASDLASGSALSAEDRVSTFEMRASAGAQRLAHILAGAPLLSLPLIQVLHEHLVPEPSTSQVAELMVSGLLDRLPEKAGERSPLLRFLPGVGDLLYRGTTISQEWDLYDFLTGYLEQNAGSGDMVRALVADPDGAGVAASDLVPFAAMGRGMALRLGLQIDALAPTAPSVADVPPVSNVRRYLLLCAIGKYDDKAIAEVPTREEVPTLTRLFESMGYTTILVPLGTASRQAVLEALRRFYRDPGRRPDDLVVLYLSSHGTVVGGEFRLLAADTRNDNVATTGIAMPDLAGLMFEGPTLCRNLIMVDSAHAGSATSELVSAALEASVPWFGAVASTGAGEAAFAGVFAQAMASTVEEWLAGSAEQSSLTLDRLVRGINGRMHRSGLQRARSETFAIADSATSVYFTRHGLPPARSRYLQLVRQIAPVQLMDRDDELAELAAFCTAPDSSSSYLMLSASPWAGKSALLASFVLDPPPGVRAVPFFVTARYAGQSDRTAFLDVMIEQLAELLSEPMPARLTEKTREMHWRQMLIRAAVSCRRAGQRLVLVVDGLDEDRGITAGADSYSIAALLPAQPPAGTRVIVAARPSPAVPSDVPSDHPLRGADVWLLTPSNHATVLRTEVQRDLHRIFDGDPATLDIIGLIVAAGGGLSGSDIAELTGLTGWEVESNVAVAGRLLATRRGRLRPNTEVYLLSHEELQVGASAMFGPRLHEYRTRLESWVGEFRSRNWPPDTPEYPLSGYFRLLASTGSLSQMLDLVLDIHRQDRLHILTGNDDALLAEIVTLTDTPIDLRSHERLADLLTVIERRSSGVPSALPRAWAALGEMARAERVAHAIVDPDVRARTLEDLVTPMAAVREDRLGQHQEAGENDLDIVDQYGRQGEPLDDPLGVADSGHPNTLATGRDQHGPLASAESNNLPVTEQPLTELSDPIGTGVDENERGALIGDDSSVGYRGVTACHAVGISYKQLDYWARTALIVPSIRSSSGSGTQRLYSFRDLVILKVVKRLLDAGVTLQNIRKAIDTLRSRGVEDLAGITLISDGTEVYECRSPEEVVDLLQGGQGVFGIAIGGAFKEIQGSLSHLPAEPTRLATYDEASGSEGVDTPRDLLKLSPREFEHLIRRLFEAMGMKDWVTQACVEEGFDGAAINEDTAAGGLHVIQAKRYSETVRLEVVRALAGIVEKKRAVKGILVTTSWVSETTRNFAAANGKIEIIEGNRLKRMLKERLGLDVFIGLKNARPGWTQKV